MKQDGKIGFGTLSPSTNLEILSFGSIGSIKIQGGQRLGEFGVNGNGPFIFSQTAGGSMSWFTKDFSGNTGRRMFLSSNGNLCIGGNLVPSEKLFVEGSIKTTGSLFANNIISESITTDSIQINQGLSVENIKVNNSIEVGVNSIKIGGTSVGGPDLMTISSGKFTIGRFAGIVGPNLPNPLTDIDLGIGVFPQTKLHISQESLVDGESTIRLGYTRTAGTGGGGGNGNGGFGNSSIWDISSILDGTKSTLEIGSQTTNENSVRITSTEPNQSGGLLHIAVTGPVGGAVGHRPLTFSKVSSDGLFMLDWGFQMNAGNTPTLQIFRAKRVLSGPGAPQFGTPIEITWDGIVGAREIIVQTAPLPDYVFDSNYNLMTLTELEKYIDANKHLPGIPSASDVEEQGGLHVGAMQIQLLEKVEELTLYVIELKKEIDELKYK